MCLTPEFEKAARQYALGELEEGPRLELEQLLVTDPRASDALGVVEDELTEAYLEGTLSAAETSAFERHFLRLPRRRRHLGFFRALGQASSSHAEQRGASRWNPASWFMPPLRQPAWLGAAASLAVLSLAGNVWLALRHDTLQHELARMRAEPPGVEVGGPPATAPTEKPTGQTDELMAANEALQAQLDAERQRLSEAATLLKRVESQVRQLRRPAPTFALAAGLMRGEGELTRVAVSPDVPVIRLRLELPGDEYPLYRAALHDVDGHELWAQSRLKAERDRAAVLLVLPGESLPRGDYQLKLSGLTSGGEPEALATYAFRVITQ